MTVYDYIRQRWPNHAQRIIECAYECDIRGAEYDLTRDVSKKPNINGVLATLFIWQETPEGYAYWKALNEGGEEVRI